MKLKSHSELSAEWLKDPEYEAAYRAESLAPCDYQIIQHHPDGTEEVIYDSEKMNAHDVAAIETEEEYLAALRVISPMFDNEPPINTPEGDFFAALCSRIAEYETKHFPLD